MPTDYSTTNITAPDPDPPGLVSGLWDLRPPLDWSPQMEAVPHPRTPISDGGRPRGTVGQVFPR